MAPDGEEEGSRIAILQTMMNKTTTGTGLKPKLVEKVYMIGIKIAETTILLIKLVKIAEATKKITMKPIALPAPKTPPHF